MSYWGSGPEESDFAFGSVGVSILHIKEILFKDIEAVRGKSYPEQSIVASLVCLRLIGERFPKNLSVHFRKKDFEKARSAFHAWFQQVGEQIPERFKERLLEEAEAEFRLFGERIFER